MVPWNYVPKPFPAWMFSTRGRTLVHSYDDVARLGDGWHDSPAKVGAPDVVLQLAALETPEPAPAVAPRLEPAPISLETLPSAADFDVVPAPAAASPEPAAVDVNPEEAAQVHDSKVNALVQGVMKETQIMALQKLRALEATNPAFPNGRRNLIKAIDERLKTLEGAR